MRRAGDQRGQAAVELVAVLPVVALLGLLAWQAVVAGQAVWLAGSAARAAARAGAIGGDAGLAARRVLPGRFVAAGVRVRSARDGEVRVSVGIPLVVAGVRLASVSTRARFAPQD
jgi:hypothetical protein